MYPFRSRSSPASKAGRYSVRSTLLLAVLGPLVVLLGLLGYSGLKLFEDWAQSRLEKEVELVARAVRLPLEHALERDRQGSIDQIVASVFRTNRVYGTSVYDAAGSRIAASGAEEVEQNRGRLSEIAAEGSRRGEYGEVAGRRVYSYFVPLTDAGGQIIGLLEVTRRRSDIEAEVRTLQAGAGGGLLLALGLVVGLVLYAHHAAIGRPMSRLSGSMDHVRGGDRTHRAEVEGPADLAALAETLNSMLDSIDETEAALEDQREHQRTLEERLALSEKLAAVGQLSAGVAHELGAPLSVVAGKAQRAVRLPDLSPPIHDTLTEIRGQVRRMESIVRQLLDFGRQTRLQRRLVSAEQLGRAAVASMREEMQGEEARIQMIGSPPGPALEVDPWQIEQVLTNLLRNSAQAAPDGEIRLGWGTEMGEPFFLVEDDGPGIPPQSRSRIFEPFFTTKKVGEGTGLGLAVAHGLIEQHGGRIVLDESPLGGARFRVVLPAPDGNGNSRAVSEDG
ncbi:MAG: ATP-binding protein [Gemmatimonadota bacterium]